MLKLRHNWLFTHNFEFVVAPWMTKTGCDWPNSLASAAASTNSCGIQKLVAFTHIHVNLQSLYMTWLIPPQNLTDQTDSSTTTKPSTSDWWQYRSKPGTSDWQQYCHKAWHIRLTALLPQSPARQTDSSTATKPGTSDWCQYHHKAQHIRLTVTPTQSPTHQSKLSSSSTTKPDSSIITKPNMSD